jgi:hypothetical protein
MKVFFDRCTPAGNRGSGINYKGNVRNGTRRYEFVAQMAQMTHSTRELPGMQDAKTLRARGDHMLELASRAYCERHYDFARLLTQLATEVFARAKDVEASYAPCAIRPPRRRR